MDNVYRTSSWRLLQCKPFTSLVWVALASVHLGTCTAHTQQTTDPWYHHGHEYRNLPDNPKRNGFSWEHFKFFLSRPFDTGDQTYPETHVIPPDQAQEAFAALKQKDTVTWIGHMTLLLQLNGAVVLTDPFLSDCATPIPPIGPCRAVPPGLKKIPQLDVVVLTHNHYDHLDLPSLETLANPQQITVLAPLKVGQYLKHIPFKQVIELDWYESHLEQGIMFTAVPSIHWSKRTFFDENETLWAGWVLTTDRHKVYYSEGDYGNVYAEIGRRYGPIDYAFISAGAYLPRAVMHGSHCVPADCVQIGIDVRAKRMIPVHWGTITLGTEGLLTAGRAFMEAAQKKGVQARAATMRIGETWILGEDSQTRPPNPNISLNKPSPDQRN